MGTAKKYICIHGHFYQPPRENAWLEKVEMQDSAKPFHDWNERINFECYAPNATARILDEQEHIFKIVNNYSRLSFNFGPTLLSWLQQADPATYQAIQQADKKSQERFGGHGSAIAQVHSHLILPLSNHRDQNTQIYWGIRDFQHRFARHPEGMWLAETAINTDTLEALAAQGIRYTILAPRQAKAWRRLNDSQWHDIHNEQFDKRRPYKCQLPSGNEIALFFYEGDIAQGVAFKGLLNNGKEFARQFINHFDENDQPQLVHIATDGESYGHHHRYGEMALADCFDQIEQHPLANLTNYGQYLELFPPEHEIQIHENSSWSCVHGIERWRSNCGCHTGEHPDWNQQWRAPLREALDWLRDRLAPIFEKEGNKLMNDPWAARDEYIDVILDRTEAQTNTFIKAHAGKRLKKEERIRLLRLLEMQRNALLMYTSCGWFFDEVSGIETNQILQYALRAIDYARLIDGSKLLDQFEQRLAKIPSNVYTNARESFRQMVLPTRVSLKRAAIHYGVLSLFEQNPENLSLFNYEIKREHFERVEAGHHRLAVGRLIMRSKLTYSETPFCFAVLYLGQQTLIGNVATELSSSRYSDMQLNLLEAFHLNKITEVIGLMQEYFGNEKYTFEHLFKDERRNILKMITKRSMLQAEGSFRDIYNDNYQLMLGLLNSHIPIPKTYQDVARFVVNLDLHRFFRRPELQIAELQRLIKELERWEIPMSNEPSFKLAASERIAQEIGQLIAEDSSPEKLQQLATIIQTLQKMDVQLDVWKCQNHFFSIMESFRSGEREFANEQWKSAFMELGKLLRIKVNTLEVVPS